MKRSDLRYAYDSMTPTSEQKDRMLQNILDNASVPSGAEEKFYAPSVKTSRLSWVSAVAALFAVILTGTFVLFRPASSGPMSRVRESVDIYSEIPQLQAAKEWADYLASYTGTAQEDLAYPYYAWDCRNQEMAAKLDEIAENHQLTFRDLEERMTDSVDFLLEEVEMESIFRLDSSHQTGSCAYWDDGQFYIAGSVDVKPESGTVQLSYLLQKTRPDVWLREYADIISDETLECWRYIHSSGSHITIGLGEKVSFLYAPIGDSAFFVQVSNEISSQSEDVLEAFAETFTFGLSAQTYDPGRLGKIVNTLVIGLDPQAETENKPETFVLVTANKETKTLTLTELPANIYLNIPNYRDAQGDVHGIGNRTLDMAYLSVCAMGDTQAALQHLGQTLYENFGCDVDFVILAEPADSTAVAAFAQQLQVEDDREDALWNSLEHLVTTMEDADITACIAELLPLLDSFEIAYNQCPAEGTYTLRTETVGGVSYQECLVPDLQTNRRLLTAITEDSVSGEEEIQIPVVYQELIRACRWAMEEGWDAEKCVSFNISPRFAASHEYARSNAGYRLLDIDGNGTLELIIGHDNYIWNLYTTEMQNSNTALLLLTDENDGTVYQLCEDGRIVKELTTKDEGWHDCYFLKDTQLITETSIYGKDTTYTDLLTGQSLSSKEALNRIDQYDRIQLGLTLFYNLPDYALENNETVENYLPIIEKYKTALQENWSWEQCDQEDISRRIMYTTTNHNNLGWALVDLDSNGVQELIVSDGTHLFDLYTLMPTDGLPGHILSGGEYTYTLCNDSTIERRITNDEFTYWTWLRLSEMDFVEEQKLILDSSLHRYYLGVDKETSQTITENEAGAILAAEEKDPMELSLVPFAEQEQTVVREANYYYEPIIELYRKAIAESWDPGKCTENGLSMMIGYYGELYDELGHNQIDLNGDGVNELIITDGTNVFDIYTVIVDEEVGAMRYALESTERNQYFMIDDQTLYRRGSGGAALTYHTLLGIGERELYVQEGFVYDVADSNGPWFFYQDEAKGSAYADAETIVNSWQPMEISFVAFGDGGLEETDEESEWEQAKQEAFDIIASGEEFGYGEYISWLIPWRNQEFENPRPLYYYLHDANGDGITDLILGYEDEVTAVWSDIYDEKAQKQNLTLLFLSEDTWAELDAVWPTWDIRDIENFPREE